MQNPRKYANNQRKLTSVKSLTPTPGHCVCVHITYEDAQGQGSNALWYAMCRKDPQVLGWLFPTNYV